MTYQEKITTKRKKVSITGRKNIYKITKIARAL